MEQTIQRIVIFVLGGPGSGKGTQCSLIAKNLLFKHLSAGDLLREATKDPTNKYNPIIQNCFKEGKIVPSEITVGLLAQAMNKHIKQQENSKFCKFLIDGFPRNLENLHAWEKFQQQEVNHVFMPLVVVLQCDEECLQKRLLLRAQTSGRLDDNKETIKKRFKTYQQATQQVIKHFFQKKKLLQVNGAQTVEEVYSILQTKFQELLNFHEKQQ